MNYLTSKLTFHKKSTFLPIGAAMLYGLLMCNSCCDAEVDSSSGIVFKEVNQAKITRIELLGTNKSVVYNSSEAPLTLNPADTVSRYKIYFEQDSGEVELVYRGRVSYLDGTCKNNLVVRYQPVVGKTSFQKVDIKINASVNYVEITR